MKKILFLSLSVFFIAFLFFLKTPKAVFANPHCINFIVKVTAKNWVGGKLQIGCPGDTGRFCKGEIKDIKPGGKTVKLGACSCFPNSNGCLTLGKKLKFAAVKNGKKRVVIVGDQLPKKCVLKTTKKFCSSNGKYPKASFKIVCTKAPITITDTVTPTGVCPVPKPVLNVKVTCPNCNQSGVSISDTNPDSIPSNYFDLKTQITINGTGFQSGDQAAVEGPYDLSTGQAEQGATIDDYYLTNITYDSSTKLTGVLPDGIPPGYFKVIIKDASGTVTKSSGEPLLITNQTGGT